MLDRTQIDASTNRLPHALWLFVLLVIAAAYCSFTMYTAPLGTAACSDSCDYQTLGTAVTAFYVVTTVALLGAAIGIYVLRGRGWLVPVAPLTALLLVLVTFMVTYAIARAAMQL